MLNERLRRTASSISIVNQQKNEEILSYLEETDSDLRKKKKQLNEQITKAYKENNINTKQGRKTLRDLHNIRFHLTVKNELKEIFGFDVIDFYSKKFEYNDEMAVKNYVNMMLKIEDIMKKEGNTESKYTENLTKKEKKVLQTLYKIINQEPFYGESLDVMLIDRKLQNFLEKGILAHFEKYDYYDLNKSKTLSRLGLNKWNIKYLLDRSSNDKLVQEGPKTLEQELYEKSEKELRKLKKDLHSSIKNENKANKKQINTDELKNNLRQFFEVRHQLFAKQVIKEAINIDVEKFCQKYASRIGIDPDQQADLFQAEVSKILKADKKKMNAKEERELKKERTILKKNIHSIYKKIQKFDKKQEWTNVNAQTHRMIDEMNKLVKINATIHARGYDYYSVKNDKTLMKLSIYVNECRLEDAQNSVESINHTLPILDDSEHIYANIISEPVYAEITRKQNSAGSKSSPEAKPKEPQHLITETEAQAQVHRDNRSEASYAQITRKPYWYKLTPQQTEYTSELRALRARLAEKNNSNPGTFENRIAESKQGSRNANALKSPSQHNSHENGISMA